MSEVVNALTIDVEDYFQVSAFERYIDRSSWDSIDGRIEKNMGIILKHLKERNIKATFFVLGWIAERYPNIVLDIIKEGHELASHGYAHTRVTNQSREEFKEDIKKTKNLLEKISGQIVRGYRAPSYSINLTNLWAYQELINAGYEYSSSVYPIKHDLYGIHNAPRFPFKVNRSDFVEIPVSTTKIANYKIPSGGGGYFRLIPYFIYKQLLLYINNKESHPCNFYFHPWEIDPDQPKTQNINMKTKFRHYINLNKTEKRLIKLMNDFGWQTMDYVYMNESRIKDYPSVNLLDFA